MNENKLSKVSLCVKMWVTEAYTYEAYARDNGDRVFARFTDQWCNWKSWRTLSEMIFFLSRKSHRASLKTKSSPAWHLTLSLGGIRSSARDNNATIAERWIRKWWAAAARFSITPCVYISLLFMQFTLSSTLHLDRLLIPSILAFLVNLYYFG